MNGELAQVMTLVAHGSVWLTDPDGDVALDRTHSSFQFVRSVSFTRGSSSVDSVAAWLQDLRADGVERLWLLIGGATTGPLPAHLAAAFAGAGSSAMLSFGESAGAELWQSSWSLGNREAPDQRIWDVRYTAVPAPGLAVPALSVATAQQQLLAALQAIHAFAAEQDLAWWSDYFANAMAAADQSDPPYHPDLFPPQGYPDEANQLAALAARSWVFGGMGSWNDLSFPTAADNERYTHLSSTLYTAVLTATAAAVNTELAQ